MQCYKGNEYGIDYDLCCQDKINCIIKESCEVETRQYDIFMEGRRKNRIQDIQNNLSEIGVTKITRKEAIYLVLNSTIPYIYQVLEALGVNDIEIDTL